MDFKDRYFNELSNINYLIEKLRKGKVYELTGTKNDGYLATTVDRLQEAMDDLVFKIAYNQPSSLDVLIEAMEKCPNVIPPLKPNDDGDKQ